MQPYFLPYLGYFQLMASVDTFVFYDDVQYMKGGWINRNRILRQGQPAFLTLPVAHDHIERTIRERSYLLDARTIRKCCDSVAEGYRRAPFIERSLRFFRSMFEPPEANVARFNIASLRTLATRLGIRASLIDASGVDGHAHLHGQDRVIALCRRLGATTYLNAAGGTALYDETSFRDAGISLRFLRPALLPYRQFADPFVPGLSILDAMMFNDDDALHAAVNAGSIVTPSEAIGQ